MDETQNYYEILGVSSGATAEEIKKAFSRKRREYQNDEEKTVKLNQAYEALFDPDKRKEYDISNQFSKKLKKAWEELNKSNSREEALPHIEELRRLYKEILKKTPENIDALKGLAQVEGIIGNTEEQIFHLKILENLLEGKAKLDLYHRLGEAYRKLGQLDESAKYLQIIYKDDIEFDEDIVLLARYYYEEKKDIKQAIQILNDCVNRSDDSRLKIIYLCETLRAIRMLDNSSYQKVEEVLYKRLESFRTDNEESNLKNAATIASILGDIIARKDLECFHRLERIYLSYEPKHDKLNKNFEVMVKMAKALEAGKIHEAIEIYQENNWTEETKKKFARLLFEQAEQIKESLDYIKKNIPEMLIMSEEMAKELKEIEELVDSKMDISKEFASLMKDRSSSLYMKWIIENLLIGSVIGLDSVKEKLLEAADSFFNKEDPEKRNYTLRKLKEFYPLCFEYYAALFMRDDESKTSEKSESYKTESEPIRQSSHNTEPFFPFARAGYEHKPYISGNTEMIILIILGLVLFPKSILLLLIIFGIKYYNRHAGDL